MTETKTRPTEVLPAEFIAQLEDPVRRADSQRLIELMQRLTGEPPRMWGPSIIGFGRYHYKYASGHEGDSCVAGFSPRQTAFSIYLNGTTEGAALEARDALLQKLGKHRMGKGCLYVKRLEGIDMAVLEKLVKLSIAETRSNHKD